VGSGGPYGVGYSLLTESAHCMHEIKLCLALLDCRRQHFGDGVIAIDGGANIGVHTVTWARHLHGWGHVLSFEAQEILFYAMAGNIVLNNRLNARARLAALGARCGELTIPKPDYMQPGNFGGLELRWRINHENIGQTISYAPEDGVNVPMVDLASLDLQRLDLLKLDIEGMELDVLLGGKAVIERHRPCMLIEIIKSDRNAIAAFLHRLGYETFNPDGLNVLAVHRSDPTLRHVQQRENEYFLVP
jgi:FkbM family methyltransferase